MKKNRSKSKAKNLNKLTEVPAEIMNEKKTLMKYWAQRFRLFSRFDEGVKMDRGKITYPFIFFFLFNFFFLSIEFYPLSS